MNDKPKDIIFDSLSIESTANTLANPQQLPNSDTQQSILPTDKLNKTPKVGKKNVLKFSPPKDEDWIVM